VAVTGGSIKPGEDVAIGADRELREESGFHAQSITELGYFYTNNRRSDQRQIVVLCKELVPGEGAADPEEFIENHWLTPEEITKKVIDGKIVNMNLLAALHLFMVTEGYSRI